MPLRMTLIVALLVLLFCEGCVKKAVYEKTQSDLELSRSSWQRCKDDQGECSQKLEECQAEKKKTQDALESLGRIHESLKLEHDKLSGDYAAQKSIIDDLNKSNMARRQTLQDISLKFDEQLKAGRVFIDDNKGVIVLRLPADSLFKGAQAQLSPAGIKTVIEIATVLSSIENRRFQVLGHTDNQRGSRGVNPNWSLSYNRARAVFDLLVKSGVAEDRLSIAAMAEYSPAAGNHSMEGRQFNRRIEIMLLPSPEELPVERLMQLEKMEKAR